jgi:hypothetical protein
VQLAVLKGKDEEKGRKRIETRKSEHHFWPQSRSPLEDGLEPGRRTPERPIKRYFDGDVIIKDRRRKINGIESDRNTGLLVKLM